jgi:AGZA family xanthine/uracil permease-like MFS transporter
MSTSTGTAVKPDFKPVLWTPGDWNAFFGFGTNILVNMLVLTGLLRFVLKMPDSLVFGRILPALGLMMCLSTFYYAYLAYRLAQKTGRTDVCALPSGISVPHMFIVTFVIMLPITIKTGDPMKGWSAGLVWVFFQSFVLMIGGFIAPSSARSRRARLLGTLAGVSVTFISMRPGAGDVHDAADRAGVLRHHPGELVRRREISEGHPGRPRRHRGRHDHRLGLEPVRPQSTAA